MRSRRRQRTLARRVEVRGRSLHEGQHVTVQLCPAEPGSGVVFVRQDTAAQVPARVEGVVDTHLATVLASAGMRVGTVEHLLAAFVGEGIDNVRVELDGDELPALDGGALQWVHLIDLAGAVAQDALRDPLVLDRPMVLRQGERWIRALPDPGLELDVTIRFPHPALGAQRLRLRMAPGVFRRELAWARTFGFLAELDQLHAAGRAQGAGLDDVLVYGPTGPLDPDALRSPDEPLRHKMLDLLGDLALLGRPLKARVIAHMPGHGLTRAFVTELARMQDAGGD